MISVTVPIYRVEQYLSKCIKSILNQTYHNFELLLIDDDDESPDSCGRICEQFAMMDERVKVIHQKNGGVSAARNTGLDHAKGEYIVFVDGDDYIAPDYLELYLKEIQKNVDLVIGGYYIDTKGSIATFSQTDASRIDCASNRYGFMVDILRGKYGWEVWKNMFRRSLIEKYQIRFQRGCEFGEDMLFYLQYVAVSQTISILTYSGYYYVIRDNSLMRKSEEIFRTDEMNELSYSFYYWCKKYGYTELIEGFPLLHFLIVSGQLPGYTYKNMVSKLDEVQEKLTNKEYYFFMMRRLPEYRQRIQYLDRYTAFFSMIIADLAKGKHRILWDIVNKILFVASLLLKKYKMYKSNYRQRE